MIFQVPSLSHLLNAHSQFVSHASSFFVLLKQYNSPSSKNDAAPLEILESALIKNSYVSKLLNPSLIKTIDQSTPLLAIAGIPLVQTKDSSILST